MLGVQRQKEMVKNLYNECMALEELLEEAVHTLGPDARDILAQIRYRQQPLLSQPACSCAYRCITKFTMVPVMGQQPPQSIPVAANCTRL